MDDTRLNILHVEDGVADALLVAETLKRTGQGHSVTLAQTLQEAEDILRMIQRMT
ncbi:MAG: hypothetical protein KDA93_22285 [Planctomycetaceae bacterium]|nr:hypothetical protein [Planctomycetaceae bacterium]